MNEAIEADVRPLAVVADEPPHPLALFSGSPREVVARAVEVADALKAVVEAKGLIKKIGTNDFVEVAGWQTLGAMTGCTARCDWTRKLDNGWEARVTVLRNGAEIGAAEAQCSRDERAWARRDEYALRSMAQTRATSKALRSVLGFIVVLAGYRDTPAEEIPEGDTGSLPHPRAPRGRRATPPPKPALAAQETPANGKPDAPPAPPADPDEARKRALAAIHLLKSERRVDDKFYQQILSDLFGDACYNDKGIPSAAMIEDIRDLRKFYGHLNARTEPLPPEPAS